MQKKQPEVYDGCLKQVMIEQCPQYPWHFYETFPVDKVQTAPVYSFANRSVIQRDELYRPDYIEDPDFLKYLQNLFKLTHEATKQALKELRNKNKQKL